VLAAHMLLHSSHPSASLEGSNMQPLTRIQAQADLRLAALKPSQNNLKATNPVALPVRTRTGHVPEPTVSHASTDHEVRKDDSLRHTSQGNSLADVAQVWSRLSVGVISGPTQSWPLPFRKSFTGK